MTTNDIERMVKAASDVTNRLLHGVANRVETYVQSVDTEALADAITGMRATVTQDTEVVQSSAEYLGAAVRCVTCQGVYRVKTDGRNPLWVCQPCARQWCRWDGVTPQVSTHLRVVGAGEKR
ncbi:hypothetical protein I3U42_01250 [Mycobacteroides abscessus subsp. abscessus]|uniref:hypothetical protein n=1 Tax=Mycobacteroides abscessus TaxID=36809 RepID=UPI0019D0C02F|nr:hypothetical protein [Mycobacteroides abscessus]QSN26465.1 hypothetical protein I3U36_01250 [Mycobacteroides abscessus subsp. abscessus]QSN31722.1 hypothetical protein I3U42_01250 [Mycobacteroides abscessus subsp. abscessus]QST89434.1 hypothetical protein PROPHIGD43A-5_25 [Mycobacterium phage prophiGD43A-5]